ncbi:MAG: YdcF family protein [Rhodobacteraceae bacterium]|nr:YdcF family protein [Paracoccaceae bacterium]
MIVLRAVRFLLALAVTTFLLTFFAVVGFAALQPFFEPDPFSPADTIVVLGAGMDADGTLHISSMLRVEKAVALFQSGAGGKMHFTGGVGRPKGVSAGEQMARMAQQLGVPEAATSFEGGSYSTLQNALLSAPYLKNAKRVILVTEGFHLPRSWASFKYFGTQDTALARSVAFRQTSPNLRFPGLTMCIREALAIWFNLGRLIVWEAMGVLSYDAQTRDAILY